ncbi:DegV family protein [Enterococcus canis]|nr:DegV family protein [Enterococcus canis]
MTFQIMTDSCCDLPYTYLKEHNVAFVSMTITLEGTEYVDDLGETFDLNHFMQQVKDGAMPTTSQINVGTYLETFRPYVEAKQPLLYIAFSSGLSGSYSSALQAVELLKEEYEEVLVYAIDTKMASFGEGLLVRKMVELKAAGHSLEECLLWLADNKMKVQAWVTVDDLKHLERGGRISKTAAAVGSLINIKPIITVDSEGKLKPVGKVRGRKKALQQIVDDTVAHIEEPIQQTLIVAYAGDLAAGQTVKEKLAQAIQVKDIELYPLGPTIASHTGYGCIAIFSMGSKR